MTAGRYDLLAEQASTLRMSLLFRADTGELDEDDAPIFEPYDFTDAVLRLQVRSEPGAAILAEVSTEDGGIVVDEEGVVTVTLTAEATSTLTRGRARYDLLASYVSGDARRLLEGSVTVHPAITEEP